MTQGEYIERLVNLLPENTFIGKQKLVFDNNSLVFSACLVESLADEMDKRFAELQDTDFINDLRDATRNLAVLGRFLAVAVKTLTEA